MRRINPGRDYACTWSDDGDQINVFAADVWIAKVRWGGMVYVTQQQLVLLWQYWLIPFCNGFYELAEKQYIALSVAWMKLPRYSWTLYLVPVEVEPTQADPFISPQPLWLRFGLYSNLKSHIYILHTRSLHTPCTVSLLYLQFQCMGRARPLYSWDLRAPPWSLNTRHSDWCHWSPRDQYAARSEYRCSPPSTSTVHRSLYINVSSFSYWIIRTDTHSRAT